MQEYDKKYLDNINQPNDLSDNCYDTSSDEDSNSECTTSDSESSTSDSESSDDISDIDCQYDVILFL